VYSILLSAFFSIGRNQLTVIDVFCAMRLTTSPITLNLVWWCVGSLASKLLRRQSYTRRKPAVIAFSILLVPIWFTLFTVVSFSWTAFKDSDQYLHDVPTYISTIIMLLLPISWPMYLNPTYGGWVLFLPAFLQWSLLLTWILYIARHVRDIKGEWDDKMQQYTPHWKRSICLLKLTWYGRAHHIHKGHAHEPQISGKSLTQHILG
jgi:hypothetical protein